MGVDLVVDTTINVDKTVLNMLGNGSSSRRDGLVGGKNLSDLIVSPASWLLSHGLRRDWRSPGIPRLIGDNAGCRPLAGGNTWICPRVDNITVRDGHGNRSSSCRGRKGRSGCSIGRNHSMGRMLIDLVSSSSLQASKFSLPFFCTHLLEDIRWDKVGVLFAIPSKKDFNIRSPSLALVLAT
jgi:hypothetical protein